MPAEPVPPEVRFLASPLGAALALALAALACAATLWWARRGDRAGRGALLRAALLSALLLALINLGARALGWWVGPIFAPRPFAVLIALTALGGVPGWTLWLAGYRWLASRLRHALAGYLLLMLVFIPIVTLADRWQMARNEFQMAAGYQIWHDVLLGQLVMAAPVLIYELLHRPPPRRAT